MGYSLTANIGDTHFDSDTKQTRLDLGDVDADGRLDIFVADASGYLYRFELRRKGKVAVGYYRGDPRNHGVWGKVKPYAKRDYKKILSPRHRPVHHIAPR
jgi:hypothetical protein